jgi:hypothetical protein
MAEPNFTKMSYQELLAHAEYAVDWLETRGFTLQDILDARKARQDRGLLLGVVWAWKEINDMSIADLQRFQGMNGRVGTEA